MATTQFDRDSMAKWYAREHRDVDPGIVSIFYLPTNADDREIRLVEVNNLIGDRTDEILEPIDFGLDRATDNQHRLSILDVTPEQWEKVTAHKLSLPSNWSLDGAIDLSK